jgi:hypothetical protein
MITTIVAAGTVVVGLLSVVALRAMARSKLIPNPGGSGERDFGLKPVMSEVLCALGCTGIGFILIVLGALAVRHRFLPDSFMTALFTVFPGLIVALVGVRFLARGSYKAVCGVVKR